MKLSELDWSIPKKKRRFALNESNKPINAVPEPTTNPKRLARRKIVKILEGKNISFKYNKHNNVLLKKERIAIFIDKSSLYTEQYKKRNYRILQLKSDDILDDNFILTL